MDMRKLAEEAIALAKTASVVLPPLGTGAALAEKVLDIVDSIREEGGQDRETEEELEVAHQQLYQAMAAKGHALSERLRGG
jgi:hypothetical protein